MKRDGKRFGQGRHLRRQGPVDRQEKRGRQDDLLGKAAIADFAHITQR